MWYEVQAPSEAESQCAAMCKQGLVSSLARQLSCLETNVYQMMLSSLSASELCELTSYVTML